MSSRAAGGDQVGRLRLHHPAEPERLRVLRRQVARWAAARGVPTDVLLDLQLVLSEAVSNGIEHAYCGRRAGSVEIELELGVDAGGDPEVAVLVVDHGRWRPIPMCKGSRGRGLALIDQLSRGLRITTSDQGTRLSCQVPGPA